jgi:hypothetical protein
MMSHDRSSAADVRAAQAGRFRHESCRLQAVRLQSPAIFANGSM